MGTTLGDRVHMSRRDLHMKQKELARLSGISRTYVSQIETGTVSEVMSDVVVKLAQALGVSVLYLLGLSDALFVNRRDGGFLSPTGVYQVFKRLARAAGLIDDGRRYNPHGLRHAWARRALQAGMDLGTVSEIMGHTGIEVTARFYARWADRELQERKEAYSRPLPVPAIGAQSGGNGVVIGRQPGARVGG